MRHVVMQGTLAFILILFCVLVLCLRSEAAHAGPFETQEVSLTFHNFFPGGRDPLITENGLPDRTLGQELELRLNNDIYDVFYWNNVVHTATDKYTDGTGPGQFRTVGWLIDLGVRLTSQIEVGYYHHSQHVLDTVYQYGGFPVEDALQVKLFFIRPQKHDSIF